MNFDVAFDRLIGHEGGYVSAAQAAKNNDPGGETKYGISKRSWPDVDIANLTLEGAKAIYLIAYWDAVRCESLPACMRFAMFDYAVNSGVKQAIKSLQRCVGAVDDGVFGPKTLAAVKDADPTRLAAHLLGHRLELMTRLPNWHENGRGWAARVAVGLKEI